MRHFLLLILILLASTVKPKFKKCGQHKAKTQKPGIFYDKKDHRQLQIEVRQVNINIYQQMRIYSDFYQIDHTSLLSENSKNFIKRQQLVATQFFKKILKVKPITQTLKFDISQVEYSSCNGYKVTEDNRVVAGVQADLAIFVTTEKDDLDENLAWASSCFVNSVDNRPVFGRISYNSLLVNTSLSNFGFETAIETTLHEMIHVLGFVYEKIQNFDKLYTGNDRNENIKDNIVVTQRVVLWAKNYYKCQDLTGMNLETQGPKGTEGQHWERIMLKNELMTGADIVGEIYISGATLALLRDSGWYDVEEIQESAIWGKNKGCDFVKYGCNAKTYFSEFCKMRNDSRNPFEVNCTYGFEGIGYCRPETLANDCGIILSTDQTLECLNPQDELKFPYINQDQEMQFGYNSRCFKSSFKKSDSTLNTAIDLRCYKYKCINNTIDIQVGDNVYTCNEDDQVLKAQKGQVGTLICPKISSFCSIPQACPDQCSSNGVCVNGQCFCANSAKDQSNCSQGCSSNQFYNDNTSLCETCSDNCLECKFSASLCTKCTQNKVLENGICNDTCNNGTELQYKSGNRSCYRNKLCTISQSSCQCKNYCDTKCVKGK